MNRSVSDSSSLTATPVSNVASNGSEAYINPSSPHILANAHHRHGCCTGRYHCDGSKCPDGPILNPAIGIPLAICTGGLSAAALGMYKGVRDHKSRKELKKAYKQANQIPPPPSDVVVPSTIPQTTEKAEHPSVVPFIAEMEGSPPVAPHPAVPEKMDDTAPPMSKLPSLPEKMDDGKRASPLLSEKMDDLREDTRSELDSTPIDGTLPAYSEISPR